MSVERKALRIHAGRGLTLVVLGVISLSACDIGKPSAAEQRKCADVQLLVAATNRSDLTTGRAALAALQRDGATVTTPEDLGGLVKECNDHGLSIDLNADAS